MMTCNVTYENFMGNMSFVISHFNLLCNRDTFISNKPGKTEREEERMKIRELLPWSSSRRQAAKHVPSSAVWAIIRWLITRSTFHRRLIATRQIWNPARVYGFRSPEIKDQSKLYPLAREHLQLLLENPVGLHKVSSALHVETACMLWKFRNTVCSFKLIDKEEIQPK
jgi:hypothetical protein